MIHRVRAEFLAVAAVLGLLSGVAGAAPGGPARDEIEHLLTFVGASACTFVRNGTEYPSDKAREHLAAKYQVAGSRIATAEAFIESLAMQSSVSGEIYRVKCSGNVAPTGLWLTD